MRAFSHGQANSCSISPNIGSRQVWSTSQFSAAYLLVEDPRES
jgi:hypothetical protein